MAASNSNEQKYYTVDSIAKLSADNAKKVRQLLYSAEQRTSAWIRNNEWKHYKTVKNLDQDAKGNTTDVADSWNDIKVYKLTDNQFHPKQSIWKVEAFVPEKDCTKIHTYYNAPGVRTQFDNETMSTFYEVPLDFSFTDGDDHGNNDDMKEAKDKQNDAEHDEVSRIFMNVCKTNAVAKGWISPRIFMNIVGIKYCKDTGEYCTLSTFVPNDMLTKELKGVLKVSEEDLTANVVGQNLSLYLGASKVENADYTKVTYILQSNNGGWLPQWAVELGMVDQHMIALFKKMTRWLLQNKQQ